MKRHIFALAAVSLVVCLLAVACYCYRPVSHYSLVSDAAGHRILVEVADTSLTRSRGLSGRNSPPAPGEGMLFVFPEPTKETFWMKDCTYALDIAWIDQTGHVISTATMAAPRLGQPLTHYGPCVPYAYALELRAGMLDALKIFPGDRLLGLP